MAAKRIAQQKKQNQNNQKPPQNNDDEYGDEYGEEVEELEEEQEEEPQQVFIGQTVKGIGTFNAEGVTAWFYGLANGLQYQGLIQGGKQTVEDLAQSECFYAIYGLVDTVDLLVHDIKNIIQPGQLGWFNAIAYDPLMFLGDFSVSY